LVDSNQWKHSEGKIPGLSRPFFSKFKDLELGKIFENGTDLPDFIRLYFIR
jgi:hypothetical protein